jgi:hypothetical protein
MKSKLLAVVIAHDEAGPQFLDRPGGWEAAARHCECLCYLPQRL